MASTTTHTVAICLGAAIILFGLGAFLFAWSGIYNVAASEPHFAITHWLLDFAKRRSVETQSLLVSRPPLDDPDLARLGAGHYYSGCAPCHGAPGEPSNPIVQQMYPEPADLPLVAPSWTPEQLFWIAKHGLKFTGMPAWVAQNRDDEVWAVVAFLRVLPKIDVGEYRRLATGSAELPGRGMLELGPADSKAETLARCRRCHDDGLSPSPNNLVPKLGGQSQAYLEMSLRHYANGLRPSGIMQPMAADLDEGMLIELAKHYAQHPSVRIDASVHPAPPDRIARGKRIASSGVPDKGIPPCLACHAGKSAPTFPKLDGQHAAYVVGQLRLWRRGLRDRTVQGAIMAAIAPRLSDEQVEDVAAYFASVREPPPTAAPVPSQPRAPIRAPRRRR
jgi:cytochrome c553